VETDVRVIQELIQRGSLGEPHCKLSVDCSLRSRAP
jgi:hypothetical protein